MNDSDYDLLQLTKKIVKNNLSFLKNNKPKNKNYYFDSDLKKEIKLDIDLFLNKYIKNKLSITNIPIISEEDTDTKFNRKKYKKYWIIDPLDGSFNYYRGILSCSISIAFFKNDKIIFGVIGEYPSENIYWGGKKIGSFLNKKKINCSIIQDIKRSIIATGFPSRFNFENKKLSIYLAYFKKFAKVRMIGSASLSLAYLSEGKFDAYHEENIMLWDIAAGLAILEGAGGNYKIKINKNLLCNVTATNNKLNL